MGVKIKPLVLVLALCLAQVPLLSYEAEHSSASPVSEEPSEQWSKTFGGGEYDGAESVIQTSDGGYALAGYTRSYGAGGSDFWLVKTDPSGNMEWSKTFGGGDLDGAYSVIQTSDGGYALAGFTRSYGAGGSDFWLVKTNPSGNMQWSKTFGGGEYDGADSVIQTSDGGYALAGFTHSYGAGGGDFWLVKTDPSGNMQWSKTFGGTDWDGAWSVIQTSDGGYALAGGTCSYGAGGSDFWLVKLGGAKTSTSLTVFPSSFTLAPNESTTLTATLTSGGNPLEGKPIEWSVSPSDAGSVSPPSGTTDASGQVTTTYTAPYWETEVTITASFAEDDQYQASSGSSTGTITAAELMPTTLLISPLSFILQAEKSTELTATLTSGGNPLEGKPIEWSVSPSDAGSVSPPSGTTDASGQVTTTYTAPSVTTQTSVTITASFAGDAQYQPSSGISSGTITYVPPVVIITWPPDGYSTTKSSVIVRGTATGVSTVKIGDLTVTVAADSTFGASFPLEEGMNVIRVFGMDEAGNIGEDTIIVERVVTVSPEVEEWLKELEERVSKLENAITAGKVGAYINIEVKVEVPEVKEAVYSPEVSVETKVENRKVEVKVSSGAAEGKTIVINIDNQTLPVVKLEEVSVLFDGKVIGLANDYFDVLEPEDEDVPEYLILLGKKGIQVLVSIPHFSVHTITITTALPEAGPAPISLTLIVGVVVAVAVIAGVLLYFIRSSIQRKLTYGRKLR